MGEAFDPDPDKIQGYVQNAGDFIQPAFIAYSFTADRIGCNGEDIPEASLRSPVLVHGACGLLDQVGLVLGSGERGGSREA